MATNPFAVDAGNDFSAGLSGLSATMANIRQGRMAEAERKRQLDAEQEQKARQAAASAAAQEAYQSRDPEKMASVSLQYPEISKNLYQVVGLDDERKVKEAAGFARDVLLSSPEQREEIFKNRIQTLQDEGRDPTHTARAYQAYLQNPNVALNGIEMDWAAGDPNGYKAAAEKHKAEQRMALEQMKMEREDARFDRAEAGRNQRAYARAAATAGGSAGDKRTAHQKDFEEYRKLSETDPDAAKAFGQAAGFVSKEGRELAPGVQLRLAKTIDQAVSAENDVNKFRNLADQMEKSSASGGVVGNAAEALKEITGSQDAVSDLRKSVAAVRAAQASGNLPPGAASDADVKIAFGPMPSDNASPAQWARYLRAQANVQEAAAKYHGFKADYISDTGSERGMLQAWKDRSKGGAKATPAPAAKSSDGWEIVE
jgi:hypothetical protein